MSRASWADDDDNRGIADKIKARRLKTFADDEPGMFPGDLPTETAEAIRNFQG